MDKCKLAEQDYNAGMKYKDIAAKYDVTLNTVKSWKKRYGWYRERGAPKLKRVHTKERGGASNGNKHAVGNKGGAAPLNNQNALKHGLYSKYIPDEALEIMNSMEEMSASDLVWNQIQIQYAAIIRAQKIMWVENSEDETRVQTQVSFGKDGSDKYEYQFAWDKQANFLNAQSRAMSTLSGLVKQFIAIADEKDQRRVKLELITAQLEKTQVEIRRLKIQNGDLTPEETADDGFIDAIKGIATDSEVWDDDHIET